MRTHWLPLAMICAAVPSLAAGSEHFTVNASFRAPAKPDGVGSLSVTFVPKDPGVHINEEPAPRLKLEDQSVLADKQAPPPAKAHTFDPQNAKYLDTTFPLSFPVAWAGKPPATMRSVTATVVYFYCSEREGWCRKGSDTVAFNVP
jgi:hypothetical protein